MKINDKVLVAFLVSAGVFSLSVAAKYVGNLSDTQKNSMMPAAKMSSNRVLLCEGTESVKFANNKG